MVYNKTILFAPLIFIILLCQDIPVGMTSIGWNLITASSLIIIWWITGPLPNAVVSLLPIILFPIMGIAPIKQAAEAYASPIIYLFLGGFIFSAAVEKWTLHKRIALCILSLIGNNKKKIILGFIIATSFISMWMSNTATAVMLLPIASSVVDLMKEQNNNDKHFAKSLFISIAFASTIGGMSTLIGSPPNGIFAAFMNETFNFEVSFVKWTLTALPISVIIVLCCYITMTKIAFKIPPSNIDIKIFKNELQKIGKFKYEEKIILICFVFMISSWVFMPYLQKTFPSSYLSDSTVALITAFVIFLIPSKTEPGKYILDWQTANKKIPWGILLLFGGGLSLAAALKYTGVINFFESKIVFSTNNINYVIILIATTTIFATTFIGNAALTSIALPIAAGISHSLNIHPLLTSLIVTFAASSSFMLPMSTPSNAVIFNNEHVKIKDMMKAGSILSIFSIIILTILLIPITQYVYDIDLMIFPQWLKK